MLLFCLNKYKDKASEYDTELNIRKKQREANLKAIQEKQDRGEKLTINEKLYKNITTKKNAVDDLGLKLESKKLKFKGNMISEVNRVTGRTRRAESIYKIKETNFKIRKEELDKLKSGNKKNNKKNKNE